MAGKSDVRYLTPIKIEEKRDKYCRFNNSSLGILMRFPKHQNARA